MSPSVQDWAASAAQRIANEGRKISVDRMAAIIAHFAEPLVQLLRDSEQEHFHCDDSWYCCGKCTCMCLSHDEDHEHDESCYVTSHIARKSGVCNCGADEWNAKVEAALRG